MNLVKFERNTAEDEIFQQLKGRMFLAVSAVSCENGGLTYQWHLNGMRPEVILTSIELLRDHVLKTAFSLPHD